MLGIGGTITYLVGCIIRSPLLAGTAFQFDKTKDKKTQESIWRDELARGWNQVANKPKSQLPGPK